MSEQTTYILNARVRSTGQTIIERGISVDLSRPRAALPFTPLTLVNLEGTGSRAGWHEVAVLGEDLTPADLELERLRGMAQRGEIVLGPGGTPERFWDMPMPEDPEGLVRRALIEDRDGS